MKEKVINLNFIMMKEIQDWIQKDKNLSILLDEIKDNSPSDEKMALAAYYQVAKMFHLPINFSDLEEDPPEADEELDKELHSVFEELAYINYLAPDKNIVDRVVFALYIVYKEAHLDIKEIALKKFGSKEKIPKQYSIYFFGSDIDARISFDISEEFTGWPDTGAVARMDFISIKQVNM